MTEIGHPARVNFVEDLLTAGRDGIFGHEVPEPEDLCRAHILENMRRTVVGLMVDELCVRPEHAAVAFDDAIASIYEQRQAFRMSEGELLK